MAFGSNGDIFVADGHQGSRVVEVLARRHVHQVVGHARARPRVSSTRRTPSRPTRAAALFVADRGNRRIQIFDQDGNFLEEWKQFGRPSGILITPDDTLYVADVQDKQGIAFGSAKDGVVRGMISGTLPESIAIGADGAVYAGETTTGRVLRKFVKQ